MVVFDGCSSPGSDEPPAFHDFIQVINADLKNLGFEVKMAKLEHDGSEWVGLANTISDDAMKKAPGLGLAELEFFSGCVRERGKRERGRGKRKERERERKEEREREREGEERFVINYTLLKLLKWGNCL